MISRLSFVVALILCLVVSPALAQPLVIPEIPPDGVYVLTIINGQATLQSATLLTVDGQPPTPPVPDPPEDPDTDPTGMALLTQASRQAYDAIPDSEAKQAVAVVVSTVYRGVAEELRSGDLNVPAADNAMNDIRQGLPDEWDGWRDATADAWRQLLDQGMITSAATRADAMDAVAEGLLTQDQVDDLDAAVFSNPLVRILIRLALEQLGSDRPFVQFIVLALELLGSL